MDIEWMRMSTLLILESSIEPLCKIKSIHRSETCQHILFGTVFDITLSANRTTYRLLDDSPNSWPRLQLEQPAAVCDLYTSEWDRHSVDKRSIIIQQSNDYISDPWSHTKFICWQVDAGRLFPWAISLTSPSRQFIGLILPWSNPFRCRLEHRLEWIHLKCFHTVHHRINPCLIPAAVIRRKRTV